MLGVSSQYSCWAANLVKKIIVKVSNSPNAPRSARKIIGRRVASHVKPREKRAAIPLAMDASALGAFGAVVNTHPSNLTPVTRCVADVVVFGARCNRPVDRPRATIPRTHPSKYAYDGRSASRWRSSVNFSHPAIADADSSH